MWSSYLLSTPAFQFHFWEVMSARFQHCKRQLPSCKEGRSDDCLTFSTPVRVTSVCLESLSDLLTGTLPARVLPGHFLVCLFVKIY